MGGRFVNRRTVAEADGLMERARQLLADVTLEREELGRARQMADHNRTLQSLVTDPQVSAGELVAASQRITAAVAELLCVARVSVWMLSDDGSQLELIDLYELAEHRHSADIVLSAADYPSYFAALAAGRAIDAHDARTDPRTCEFTRGYLTPLGIRSMLDAAIRASGRVVGVVCLEHVGDASRRWVAEEISLAGAVGDVVGMVLFNRERRESEQQIRELNAELEARVEQRTAELADANRELEAFSYSVSHDLRAPLRHLSGFANILMEDFAKVLPDDAREYLHRIDESAHRMETLVEGLLELSRLGRRALRTRAVEHRSMIESVWNELGADGAVARHQLVLGELPDCVADPALVRQIWANLLDNAVKYSASREHPRIEVSGGCADRRCWYRVRDNGVGFPGEPDKLFGLFTRAHDSRFPGTGIGLALVQRIVARHGGTITAESSPEGATFEFTLPSA